MKPMDIEKESFAIIEKELTTDIPAEYKPVVKRVIHTTADFSYETSMTFSKGVIEEALKAIKEGVDIVTDTNMAKSGISHKMAEKFSCSLNCYMADSDVASEAAKREVTRATVSVEKAAKDNPYRTEIQTPACHARHVPVHVLHRKESTAVYFSSLSLLSEMQRNRHPRHSALLTRKAACL